MYRIMLADDEGIVIDSLKFIIEKEFGNTCEIAYAKSGRSVIELAGSFHPDIAIMDIQMPGINGIEAMKEIRKQDKNVIFIVMSAYDKFDYAKEAIKLGVVDYITKPMEKSRIIAVLKKAMEKIDNERTQRSNELIVKEKLETVVPIIENGLIYSILFQEYFTQDIENYKNILGIEEEYFYMLSLAYGDEQEGNYLTNAVGSSVKMQKYYQEVRENIKEFFPKAVVGMIMANKIAVLVPYKAEIDYNERIELIEKSRELARRMRRKINISFRIGIGNVGQLRDMAKSYEDALRSLVLTTGSVAHAEDLSLNCEYEADYPVDLEKELFEHIEKGQLQETISVAEKFFDWMVNADGSQKENTRLKVLEFVLWAEKIAYEKGGRTYSFFERKNYLDSVTGQDIDEAQLKAWFLHKLENACSNVLHNHDDKSLSLIEQAKEYIQSNYQKDISLADVSREVNISPYYFSKVFKEETGENFIEYLTSVRINQAKALLNRPELSMKEICALSGYSDPNYFSRLFKKNVGLTPTEYKESNAR